MVESFLFLLDVFFANPDNPTPLRGITRQSRPPRSGQPHILLVHAEPIELSTVLRCCRCCIAADIGPTLQIPSPSQCATVATASLTTNPSNYTLRANSSTVHWGYISVRAVFTTARLFALLDSTG